MCWNEYKLFLFPRRVSTNCLMGLSGCGEVFLCPFTQGMRGSGAQWFPESGVERGLLCPAEGPSPLAEELTNLRIMARAEQGTFGAGVIAYVVLIAHSSC